MMFFLTFGLLLVMPARENAKESYASNVGSLGDVKSIGAAVVLQSNTTHRSCHDFPEGLEVEKDVIIDASMAWQNQCRTGTMIVGLWSSVAKQIMEDMKCCSGLVDQHLSVLIFDLHYKDNGSSRVEQVWNLQCPDNHVMTGLKIVENALNSKKGKHLAGVKCSLLINQEINYQECFKVDLANINGIMRDPSYLWTMECPSSTSLVGLYDQHEFKSLQYAKCCKIQATKTLTNLAYKCPVSPNNLCGWSLSRDTTLKWGYLSSGGGTVHYLYLNQLASSGSARISSPGYSARSTPLCFRITFMIRLYAAIRVYLKTYNRDDRVAILEEIGYITKATWALTKKDFLFQAKSNFQIVVEGQRLKSIASTVMISEVSFVEASQCNADRCSSPFKGCAINEICLPNGPQGYKECVCQRGYRRVNGVCSKGPATTASGIATATTPRTTLAAATTGGQDRGGGGKTDGKGEKKPDPHGGRDATGSKTGSKNNLHGGTSFHPWVYTAVAAICGTLLVLLLVFAFLTYRKRRLTQQRYRFDFDVNYLRPRSFSGSVISDNNNSYVAEPTIQLHNSDIIGRIEIDAVEHPNVENLSTSSGTPPSHHYFEVEPETDFSRKVSQITLTSPVYGSSEDIVEDCSDEIFLEPPSDEQELCAQLNKEIERRNLKILPDKQLGQGAFGYVHLGIWHRSDDDNKTVAIKSMKDSGASEERIKFLQEAAIMKQFAHQNVVFMFGVVTKRYPPMIVLEYMQNGNLRKYLSRERRSRMKHSLEQQVDRDLHRTFLRMAREIVAGMAYLAGMQFVHRDLAARNILLDENMVCKIGDFGLARDLIGCEHYISQGGQIPVKWTAPEALTFRRYSTASDVWSFGVLLFEMFSVGKKPYEKWSNDEVVEKVCYGRYRLPPPKDCPRVIYHLMIDCWHPEESQRPRFSQIKYCLAQSDVRLLGRGPECRQRSVTLTEMTTIKEENYGELQYTYCKTD